MISFLTQSIEVSLHINWISPPFRWTIDMAPLSESSYNTMHLLTFNYVKQIKERQK